MWTDIMNNTLQGRALREFRAEQMNLSVDYVDKITCEYVGKTIGVSDTKYVQTGKTNTRYRSYAKSTRENIKSSIASPQECVGGNQNPEVTGGGQIK